MKTHIFTKLGVAALLATVLFASPTTASASDHWWSLHRSHHSDHGRDYYMSRPRSSFAISLGSGYAGRGYYYGPPSCSYYYQRPGVVYYRSESAIPRSYGYHSETYYRPSNTAVSVQKALARKGYYYGPIDGDIGSGSRRAIARYQADHGLRPTGDVSSSLLRSLGLD